MLSHGVARPRASMASEGGGGQAAGAGRAETYQMNVDVAALSWRDIVIHSENGTVDKADTKLFPDNHHSRSTFMRIQP